jgi:hypothetical protein
LRVVLLTLASVLADFAAVGSLFRSAALAKSLAVLVKITILLAAGLYTPDLGQRLLDRALRRGRGCGCRRN